MAVQTNLSQSIIRQQIEQKPPAYILQSWHREQTDLYDDYLLSQTFLIAPDTNIPSSTLRQRIKNIYDERARSLIAVVHCDPWTKEETSNATRTKTASTSTKDLPTNVDVMRSHTIL
ncbi:unnamed protein product [Adineta steineri]|uniref:Uncharacterized protein n=1 Tax=Adineta steineri TaxID=433720 RepID=A0A818M433_9BILA|nr:unnamed protein product [Adineta steineri]CAF0991726.1 unnamed protein product [Adineta steineri]CAF1057390.1 unnamed protein product [Adineta steineri]CAF1131701.1 unnamed protein product [Adineta steineri]CAF1133757.1 unnamed protein product [Adineta steineri]